MQSMLIIGEQGHADIDGAALIQIQDLVAHSLSFVMQELLGLWLGIARNVFHR
ncbi:hypothetical protein [Vibrio vulnificus YJ016]|uniref:Uncharacterized protein n=1 Tax=Vibrio vulnificus (strain YJ016) TaxID=196600 RepID=Q7MCT9_VIBVY|nr:hypothetical protein [Vibrio vulnificus YJ016]